MKVNACLIGLGNIAYGYDAHIKEKKIVLTHYKALQYFKKKINLKAIVEIDQKKIKNFKNKTNANIYSNVEELIKFEDKIDIAIISVGKFKQLEVIKKISRLKKIKTIICEKPLSYNFLSAKKILNIAKEKKINFFINFQRRFNPAIINLKQKIRKKKFGKIKKIFVCYGSTLENGGSHFLDTINFLFGAPKKIEISDYQNKQSPDFKLIFSDFIVYFLHIPSTTYEYGIVNIYTDKYLVSYKDDEAIKVFSAKNDLIYTNEKKLKFLKKIDYRKNFNIGFFYENLLKNFRKKNKSNLNQSIYCVKLVEKIIKKYE